MQIKNSFIGGCVFAVGYALIGLILWSVTDGIAKVMRMANIEMSPVEYLAYVLNGFSSNFEYFEFHIFIGKVVILNLLLFYIAAYVTED